MEKMEILKGWDEKKRYLVFNGRIIEETELIERLSGQETKKKVAVPINKKSKARRAFMDKESVIAIKKMIKNHPKESAEQLATRRVRTANITRRWSARTILRVKKGEYDHYLTGPLFQQSCG